MKEYEKPDMEIVMFEDEDVITTSGTPTCNPEYTCPIYCSVNCSEWCGAADCFEGG